MSVANCHCGECVGDGTCCIKLKNAGMNINSLYFTLPESTVSLNQYLYRRTSVTHAEYGSLPNEVWLGMASQTIPLITFTCRMDAETSTPDSSNGFTWNFSTISDRNIFISNLTSLFGGGYLTLRVKVTERWTTSNQPTHTQHRAEDGDGKILETSTNVGDVLEYKWAIDDLPSDQNNQLILLSSNIVARTGSWPLRSGCVSTTCEAQQACTWGEDPEISFSVSVPVGDGAGQNLSGSGWSGEDLCAFIGAINGDCGDGPQCGEDELGGPTLPNLCPCCRKEGGAACTCQESSACPDVENYPSCARCCACVDENGNWTCGSGVFCDTAACACLRHGIGDECTEEDFCNWIGGGSDGPPGAPNTPCFCHGYPCDVDNNACVDGHWNIPECAGCTGTNNICDADDANCSYVCMITNPWYCNALPEIDEDVEWSCFSGHPECQQGSPAPCPCLSDISEPVSIDNTCGCYIDRDGNDVIRCNSAAGHCRAPFGAESPCSGVADFTFTAKKKDFIALPGFVISTLPTYKDQVYPAYCGCDTTETCTTSIDSSWGHLDPCFSITADDTCCPNWCDGLCGKYDNITLKSLHHCHTDANSAECTECGGKVSPKAIEGSFLTLTLTNDDIYFSRTTSSLMNKLIAYDSDTDSNSITTNNNQYTVPTDASDGSTWDNILGVKGSLFDSSNYLPGGDPFSTGEAPKVFSDFSNLSSTWKMETYCWWDLVSPNPAAGADAVEAFALIKNQGWPSTELIDQGNTVWLRVYSEDTRGLYKTPVDLSCDTGETTEYKYQIDHVYSSNSEGERGYSDCLTKDGTDCTSDSSCLYCNPWKAAEDATEPLCASYIDADGAAVTPTSGSNQFPIKPYQYRMELWYVGTVANPCDGQQNISVPNNFYLVATVREVADCESVAIPSQDNDNQDNYILYNDTCGSYYWQCKTRTTKLVPYILSSIEGSLPSAFQTLNAYYEDELGNTIYQHPGVDEATIPRWVEFFPSSEGATESLTGDSTQDSTTILTPASSVAWNENAWYNIDPRHNFDAVGKGVPQAIGRWTELPFKNYARDYLNEDKTIPGFYLTISAYHMDGIRDISYCLDGAVTGTGTARVLLPTEHPLESSKAQIVKDSTGTFLNGLKEYTVSINTASIASGIHEVRAKITPQNSSPHIMNSASFNQGSARFLYGEPPTGDASVITTDGPNPTKGSSSYQVISGENWPFSLAQWPANVPDGPPVYDTKLDFANQMKGIDRSKINLNPNWGAENFWNLHNNGFDYYADASDATSKTKTTFTSNNYIFSGTSQQELLLNGYESFWFNYNAAPVTIYVGQAGDVIPSGSTLTTSIADAFAWLEANYTADNASLHDAEIILIAGTSASPRKYHWPNSYENEALPTNTSWCQNASQKKSLVIRTENPDDKDATIMWFPPSVDRIVIPWNNFALHVRDITIYTSSLRGEENKTCLHSSGTNCRLLVENVIFASICSTGIKASTLIDGSGNVICGDTLQRASNGTVTGQIDYSKCRNINTTTSNLECAETTADCASVTCCGAKVIGGCEGCTGASCDRCRKNCLCRSVEIQWWPFFCSNTLDVSANGTNLAPVILCGNNDCTSGDSWACKGVFGSDIVTSSAFMCLGTEPDHCVILGLFNQELMDLASSTEWGLGLFGKDIEVNDVPGTSLKNPVLIKHLLAENYTKNLIATKGHGMIIDVWVVNGDPFTSSDVPDNDIVTWEAFNLDTYSLVATSDYDVKLTGPNPRKIRNFNCFIENRMMVNVKVDNCHSRIINMKGPDLRYRDFLSNPTASWAGYGGHHNNFGMPSIRNFVFKDIHIEDQNSSDQVFGVCPINHLYIDNFVISTNLSRNCTSTDASTATCGYADEGGLFPLCSTNLEREYNTYLHYGRKQIQNLYLNNSLFQNLGTGEFAWDKTGTTISNVTETGWKYQNSFDWGRTFGKSGSYYNIPLAESSAGITPYFWRGSHGVILNGIRQQRTGRVNSPLLTLGSSTGPVVHKVISPPLGHTAGYSGCDYPSTNYNSYSIDATSTSYLSDAAYINAHQLAVFGAVDSSSRISTYPPKIARTFITGRSRKTADNKTACYDLTKGTCSGESDPFQFPSHAHSNLIAYGEGLSSGNIFSQGIPNVGGMQLEWAIPKGYYHDTCTFQSIAQTCKRNAILDGRDTIEPLTVISLSGVTYSWITNTAAECDGKCKNIRDHYFIDTTDKDNRIDLDWIPIIDECRCSDV